MYSIGEGVVQNHKEAYFWLLLAAANGLEEAKVERDTIAQELSKEQQEEVQARATKWFAEHSD